VLVRRDAWREARDALRRAVAVGVILGVHARAQMVSALAISSALLSEVDALDELPQPEAASVVVASASTLIVCVTCDPPERWF
jgi:hypothetical protein